MKEGMSMSKGGKRDGSGRKRVGVTVNTRIEEGLLDKIEEIVDGKSRAEKIRVCLKAGLKEIDGGGLE